MTLRSVVRFALFFLALWLAVMFANIMIHELGHGLTGALIGGWRNSLVLFGGTHYQEPVLWQTTVAQLQASGLSPAEWSREHNLTLIVNIAEQLPPFRLGVMGGWLAQLAATGLALWAIRSRPFQEGASSFARLYWGSLVLSNPAWLGGLWFLVGVWPPTSTDSAVLTRVILEEHPLGLGLTWAAGLACLGVGLFLAARYGGWIFAPLGLDEARGRRLAVLWTTLVALGALSAKLPAPGGLERVGSSALAVLVMTIGPTWMLARLCRRDDVSPRVPAYVWLGLVTVLVLIATMALTRSGFVVRADPDVLGVQVIQASYCEQINCAPEDVLRWFR